MPEALLRYFDRYQYSLPSHYTRCNLGSGAACVGCLIGPSTGSAISGYLDG